MYSLMVFIDGRINVCIAFKVKNYLQGDVKVTLKTFERV